MRRLLLGWGSLLGLLVAELLLMLLHLGPVAPFVALAMAAIVVMGPMELGQAPAQGRVFALAGAFWVVFVLFGLGMLDPLTRHDPPSSFHSEP